MYTAETSSLRTVKISRLCSETSTKLYVHEFGFCTGGEPQPRPGHHTGGKRRGGGGGGYRHCQKKDGRPPPAAKAAGHSTSAGRILQPLLPGPRPGGRRAAFGAQAAHWATGRGQEHSSGDQESNPGPYRAQGAHHTAAKGGSCGANIFTFFTFA
jgi:hypothetical protein